MSKFIFEHKKDVMKQLPKNTKITTFFEYHSSNVKVYARTFGLTNLPDGRILLTIVHCWDDGEIMDYSYDFGEGFQSGLNPLHIVRIYDKQMSKRTIERDLDRFLKRYYKKETHTCDDVAYVIQSSACNCDSKGGCSR